MLKGESDLDRLLPEGVLGGPTDPMLGFEAAYDEVYKGKKRYGGATLHPLYLALLKRARWAAAREPVSKKCDEAFAEYLACLADVVVPDYYKGAVKFVLLYRECLNEYGKRLESLKPPGELAIAEDSSEKVPEISNEFLGVCMDGKTMAPEEAIQRTHHLCVWLFVRGYTLSKVTLSQTKPGEMK